MLHYEDPGDLVGELLNQLNGFNPFNSLKYSFWIFLALIIGLILMYVMFACSCKKLNNQLKSSKAGIPGWRSGLAPAFGPGRDPGDPGSSPTSGSRCREPASPSACVSASLSHCVPIIN